MLPSLGGSRKPSGGISAAASRRLSKKQKKQSFPTTDAKEFWKGKSERGRLVTTPVAPPVYRPPTPSVTPYGSGSGSAGTYGGGGGGGGGGGRAPKPPKIKRKTYKQLKAMIDNDPMVTRGIARLDKVFQNAKSDYQANVGNVNKDYGLAVEGLNAAQTEDERQLREEALARGSFFSNAYNYRGKQLGNEYQRQRGGIDLAKQTQLARLLQGKQDARLNRNNARGMLYDEAIQRFLNQNTNFRLKGRR